jgi:hypothetical protein
VFASWTSEQTVGAPITRDIETFPQNAKSYVPKMATRMDGDPISEYDDAVADVEVEVNCDCAIKVSCRYCATFARRIMRPLRKMPRIMMFANAMGRADDGYIYGETNAVLTNN